MRNRVKLLKTVNTKAMKAAFTLKPSMKQLLMFLCPICRKLSKYSVRKGKVLITQHSTKQWIKRWQPMNRSGKMVLTKTIWMYYEQPLLFGKKN